MGDCVSTIDLFSGGGGNPTVTPSFMKWGRVGFGKWLLSKWPEEFHKVTEHSEVASQKNSRLRFFMEQIIQRSSKLFAE